MSLYHEQLAKWIELSKLHANHRLCFSIFLTLLESIASTIKEMKYSDDEVVFLISYLLIYLLTYLFTIDSVVECQGDIHF